MDECPGEYKLIYETKKCIKNCASISKYEYNGICYTTCPGNSSPSASGNKCELDCKSSGKYFNYEKTDCIDAIPSGYYLSDPDTNSIEKCHENCATCTSGPTVVNNNCDSCKTNLIFNSGNCEACYESCETCSEIGDSTNHKCSECITNYEFKNDFPDISNCYQKCQYNYYYDSSNVLQCTSNNNCPTEYPKLVIDKKRCIDNCRNDNINKYEFKNKCYREPPPNTVPSADDPYYCEEIVQPLNKCILKIEQLNIEEDDLTNEELNSYGEDYKQRYGSSRDYVLKLENDYYKIFIYNNIECLEETAEDAPLVDFGNCDDKVKTKYGITSDLINIIVLIKDRKNKKQRTSFAFANPSTGQLINISDTCAGEKIEIKENIISLIEESDLSREKKDMLIDLTKQGVNVFNPTEDFYIDICYYYDSPNDKDIPMKDRASLYYPNITVCEPGCKEKDINIKEMKLKCDCTFNSFIDKDYLNNNIYGQSVAEFLEIINSLNVECIKCLSKIFKSKYFVKCFGGFIILILLIIELICGSLFLFVLKGFDKIRQHLYFWHKAFKKYRNQNKESAPPKKKNSSDKHLNSENDIKITKAYSTKQLKNYKENKSEIDPDKRKKNNVSEFKSIKAESKRNLKDSNNKLKKSSKKVILENIKEDNIIIKNKSDDSDNNNNMDSNMGEYMEIIKGYIAPPFDENDFDDVVEKGKRTFCQYFTDKFINNQFFINTFYVDEVLRPRPLKIIVLCLTIELYLVINALFYTDDYLSERFNSDEPESFFSFIPKRINEFIYISCVNGVVSYLI